ncbi:hypothetical protein [Lysobacter sp. yr284]|uniref:hypothetical protein n=1 Tax=Lysobacter sp. yr284 TaxID=1761791 RepID=UPI0011137F93|nr:hypothetical protein [Lysobacter sp. yr284]
MPAPFRGAGGIASVPVFHDTGATMATIRAPYCVSSDPAARRWWSELSEDSKRALLRSWDDDERADPIAATAQRAAQLLKHCLREQAHANRHWQPDDGLQPLQEHMAAQGIAPTQLHGGPDPPITRHSEIYDNGMIWKIKYAQGRWDLDTEACSQDARALAERWAASG